MKFLKLAICMLAFGLFSGTAFAQNDMDNFTVAQNCPPENPSVETSEPLAILSFTIAALGLVAYRRKAVK